MRTGQSVPARVLPQCAHPPAWHGPGSPDTALHVLHALRHHGIDLDEERFAEEHASRICYFCKVPYHQSLAECPCPHWLLMPASDKRSIVAVLDTCDIGTVLCFLLSYIRANDSRSRLAGERSPYGCVLHLPFDRRVLVFTAAAAGGGASITLRRATRGRDDMLAAAGCRISEAHLLAALACSIPLPRSAAAIPLPVHQTNDFKNAHPA